MKQDQEGLKNKYYTQVFPVLKKELKRENILALPRIEKVTVNVGAGAFFRDAEKMEEILNNLKIITGQKPVLTKARQAISGFKIRKGLEVGAKVTLRGNRQWDFLGRLINTVLPRIRDFQGLPQSFVDQAGNLNIGIKEQLVFPEIVPEKTKTIFGLQVIVTTTATNRKEGMELFRNLGFPIKK